MSLSKVISKIAISLHIRELGSVAGSGKPHLSNRVMAEGESCIFCKIVSGKDEKTLLLYQDEKFAVFPDIRPAATHHFLVCPREHIRDVKVLTEEHIPLVETLVNIGKQVLNEKGGDIQKARFGFHWPPFCSVHHLHLHVISPVDGMRTFPWLIGMFSPSTPWFRSVEWVLERMKSIPTTATPAAGDKVDT